MFSQETSQPVTQWLMAGAFPNLPNIPRLSCEVWNDKGSNVERHQSSSSPDVQNTPPLLPLLHRWEPRVTWLIFTWLQPRASMYH